MTLLDHPWRKRDLTILHLQKASWMRSEVDLFRYGKGVIDLNAEISDGALDLGMAEQKLHGSKVANPTIDQGRLCSSQGMGAELVRV